MFQLCFSDWEADHYLLIGASISLFSSGCMLWVCYHLCPWNHMEDKYTSIRFMSILIFLKESKACHNHGPEQYEKWKRLVKYKHIIILYLSRMEIPTLVGNFELKTLSRGRELWIEILSQGLGNLTPNFCSWLSPPRIPCLLAPLGAAYSTYVSKNVRLHRNAPIYRFQPREAERV